MKVTPIGRVETGNGEFTIILDEPFRPGLKNLDGFSHIAVFWWFDGADTPEARHALVTPVPYKR